MTTGPDITNLYSFDDPLGNFQTSFGGPFWQQASSLNESDSNWSDDDEDDDDDGDWFASSSANKKQSTSSLSSAAAAAIAKKQQLPTPSPAAVVPPPQRESSSGSVVEACCVRRSSKTRVRFNDHLDIRSYDRIDREYYGVLFYSCHELQIMIDEAKNDERKDHAKTAA